MSDKEVDEELEASFKQAIDEALNEERREIKINFWITPSEEEQLKERCQGIKVSKYIRSILFGYAQPRPRQMMPEINRATYMELGKLTKLIEKQTEATNKRIFWNITPKFNQGYLHELGELREVVRKLRKELTFDNELAEVAQEEDEVDRQSDEE